MKKSIIIVAVLIVLSVFLVGAYNWNPFVGTWTGDEGTVVFTENTVVSEFMGASEATGYGMGAGELYVGDEGWYSAGIKNGVLTLTYDFENFYGFTAEEPKAMESILVPAHNIAYSMNTTAGKVSLAFVSIVVIGLAYASKTKYTLSTKSVVAIGIGGALYGALMFLQIPIGPNTSLRVSVALLTIFGALFGPIVGFLVGFIGHALGDALMWGSVWWSWVFLSAIMGLFAGIVTADKKFNILAGKYEKKHIILLYVYSIISILAASAVAYAGDVFLYGEPADKVWLQIILASVSNFAVIAIVGIPSVIAIGYMKKSNQKLEMEQE